VSTGIEYACGSCGDAVFIAHSQGWPQQCPNCQATPLRLNYGGPPLREFIEVQAAPKQDGEASEAAKGSVS
jgi:hypothetical protein